MLCVLVPARTSLPCMYVFVDISIDVDHFVRSVALNFPRGSSLVVAGTIQFVASIQVRRTCRAARSFRV
jgi:2-(3-amino-3-carboxypropyl)histidine synthase